MWTTLKGQGLLLMDLSDVGCYKDNLFPADFDQEQVSGTVPVPVLCTHCGSNTFQLEMKNH